MMSGLNPVGSRIISEALGDKTHRRSDSEHATIFGDCCIYRELLELFFHACAPRGPEIANE
jgi:hypothetical protein